MASMNLEIFKAFCLRQQCYQLAAIVEAFAITMTVAFIMVSQLSCVFSK